MQSNQDGISEEKETWKIGLSFFECAPQMQHGLHTLGRGRHNKDPEIWHPIEFLMEFLRIRLGVNNNYFLYRILFQVPPTALPEALGPREHLGLHPIPSGAACLGRPLPCYALLQAVLTDCRNTLETREEVCTRGGRWRGVPGAPQGDAGVKSGFVFPIL
jgi:hypothetical protein